MSDGTNPALGVIEVRTSFFPLAFLLALVQTNVIIDGQRSTLPWGNHAFPVHPGRHRVRVTFNYFFFGEAGANELDLDVPPGYTVVVKYRSPWLVFLAGPMSIIGSGPTALPAAPMPAQPLPAPPPAVAPPVTPVATPAGWYPDTTGRHELRYWDGQAWTPHASDQGTAVVDPP